MADLSIEKDAKFQVHGIPAAAVPLGELRSLWSNIVEAVAAAGCELAIGARARSLLPASNYQEMSLALHGRITILMTRSKSGEEYIPATDIVGKPMRDARVDILDQVKLNHLQNLIHDALIMTGHVEKCAIIRRKDSTISASSAGFQLHADQVQLLIDAFKSPAKTREEGVYFDDLQYKCVRADRNSVYAKATKRGLVLVRTHTQLLAATYTETMHPSVCVEAVEKLADYFKDKGK